MSHLNLELTDCRSRQARLLSSMQDRQVDRAVLVRHEHVQYLTGFRPHALVESAVVLEADGHCTLAAPNAAPDGAAADQVVTFEAQWLSTLRQEQMQAVAAALGDALAGRSAPTRLAVEASACGPEVIAAVTTGQTPTVDIEPDLWFLRRRKDTDELAMMRRAIDCTRAMYARAREIIEPGISELQVFNQLHAAAVEVAEEPLTALGNDYQSNASGGPPRPRAAQAGELYILDLGPGYRGYHADNCRTIAVDRQPTDLQYEAWNEIVQVLELVEQTVRPGVSCRDVYQQVKTRLDKYRPDSFFHHLGHGVGLYPHEAPHLNPLWDDTFAAGDLFTAEPGLYFTELQAGIRLEQNYLVTPSGVELLTTFPLELA